VKPALKDVTLCAADCICPGLAARALRESMAACEFGDAVLFTDAPIRGDGFRVERIGTLGSVDDYSRFVLKSLAGHVSTPYALVTQWDGYVTDAAAWTPEFLQVDYIGAPWHWYNDGMTVGNGGFSLRSRKLLEATAAEHFPFTPGMPEDHQISRQHRMVLAGELGMRFAPEPLAARFSYERSLPARPTFGFHGVFNLWRHVEDREMAALAPALPDKVARSFELVELLVQYVVLRKFKPFDAVYARARAARPMAEVKADARRFTGDARFLALFDGTCERAESPR
jgi:hypothetical protein